MTDCAIEIDLAHTRTYEAGAILLAVLALPGEDENTRGGLIFSLCHLALQARFDLRASEAQVEQPIKPIYAFRSGDDLRGDLKKLKRLLRDRMLAARMAIPLLQKAMGVLPSQLPEGLAKLTLDELSTWVARELADPDDADAASDSSNIETRIWRPSLPVIHLAVALAVTMQDAVRQGLGEITIGHILTHRWIIEKTIDDAETYEAIIERDGAFPGRPVPLIKVRLRPA